MLQTLFVIWLKHVRDVSIRHSSFVTHARHTTITTRAQSVSARVARTLVLRRRRGKQPARELWSDRGGPCAQPGWPSAGAPQVGGALASLRSSEKREVLLRRVGTLQYLLTLSEGSACQVPIFAVAA